MEAKGFAIDNVVVSATRWRNQSIRQTPFKITSCQKTGSHYSIRKLPPTYWQHQEKYIYKKASRVGKPYDPRLFYNRLLYSVDGVRMNTAIFRAGNLQNVISLSIPLPWNEPKYCSALAQ